MVGKAKEHPLLVSAPMVKAILEGRKTQTRRIIKMPKEASPLAKFNHLDLLGTAVFTDGSCVYCPFGRPGDRLWVREKHAVWERDAWIEGGVTITPPERGVYYWADQGAIHQVGRWTPSIHMPRWASRITLEVEDIRVEKLQDISEADAIAEGISKVSAPDYDHVRFMNYVGKDHLASPIISYETLWESISGPESWQVNPYVWAVTFRRILDPS